MAAPPEPVSPERARELLAGFAALPRRERIPLDAALGRVPAADVAAPHPHPAFPRAQRDGFAVHAADTFGASPAQPASLVADGFIAVGEGPGSPLPRGACRGVMTGGALPEGCDAVVRLPHARELSGRVEIREAAAVGDHVLFAGDDIAQGAAVARVGERIGPPTLAALAAFGILEVEVVARPRVGIVVAGDEIVGEDEAPGPGRVRDQNGVGLAAQVREAGGEPLRAGRVGDDPRELTAALRELVMACDLVLVSGGSSPRARDAIARVLEELGPPGVLARGLQMAPGKATILAAHGEQPIVGLPGHPVSSFLVFRNLVNPLVRRLGGERGLLDPFPRRARARLARALASKPGREDWVRVRIIGAEAHPLPASGALSSLLGADGCVVVPFDGAGLAGGSEVEVLLF